MENQMVKDAAGTIRREKKSFWNKGNKSKEKYWKQSKTIYF